jgi:hypothetical protein
MECIIERAFIFCWESSDQAACWTTKEVGPIPSRGKRSFLFQDFQAGSEANSAHQIHTKLL